MDKRIKETFWLYLQAHRAPAHILESHPVFLGNITLDPETKEIIFLGDPENYEKAMARIKTHIDEAQDLRRLFSILRTPYLIAFLDYIQEFLTDKEFSERLGTFWNVVEYPHQHGIMKLVKMWKRANPKDVMMPKDYELFQKLPETLTIYRGLQGKKSSVRGLAWSLEQKKAEWFANRWNHKGKVYQARIAKKDCFAFYEEESEVVVNPYCLKNVQLLSTPK